MYLLEDLLKEAVEKDASDLHLKVGTAPVIRVYGELVRIGREAIKSEEIKLMAAEVLNNDVEEYNLCGEYDTGYEVKGIGRFRFNIFKERGQDSISIRIIKSEIISLDKVCFYDAMKEFIKEDSGLILVTGPTGCGKSTTIASMVEEINKSRSCHIIMLEEPIEYVFEDKRSIVSQREIGKDTKGYEEGINAALREDPDVIVIGEMRDINTIKAAIKAAETGHLVLSTLHTFGACESINRIICSFPKEQQEEVKQELSLVLKGVIWQRLIKRCDNKGRCAAMEIMRVTPAIKNLIREGKVHQIKSSIETGNKYGMVTMEKSISDLYKKGYIC